MKNSSRTYLFILFCSIAILGKGQETDIYKQYDIYRNPMMVFLNKFSFSLTTGYSATNYRHKLEGLYFYQDRFRQLVLSNSGEMLPEQFVGFSDWLNDPMPSDTIDQTNFFVVPFNFLENPVNNPLLGQQALLIDTDTTELRFTNISHGIPIQLSVHYNFLDFRIGGGFSLEKQFVRRFEPTLLNNGVRIYRPNFTGVTYNRLFGFVGYKFYEYWNYTFVGELQFSKVGGGGNRFNNDLIRRGIATSIGVTIEQNWSEYFRIIVKPAYEIKSFTVTLPDGGSIRHGYNSFSLTFGVSINIPEIPRSPYKSDHVQLKHVITAPNGRLMEVRGQPLWKVQNPKVGQNHRKLWRYKNKNKKKLNPY